MKKIVITGVSTGIGYSSAKILCNAGYAVFGSVRKSDDAEKIKSKLGENFYPLIFDITDSNFVPKPHLDSYKKLIEKFRLDPAQSILIEDIAHNLEQAKNLGMKTVWLENNEAFASKDKDKPYIDYKIKGPLSSFLQKINILKAA